MSRRESVGAIWSKPRRESGTNPRVAPRAGQVAESRERLQILGGGTPQMVLARPLAGAVGIAKARFFRLCGRALGGAVWLSLEPHKRISELGRKMGLKPSDAPKEPAQSRKMLGTESIFHSKTRNSSIRAIFQ